MLRLLSLLALACALNGLPAARAAEGYLGAATTGFLVGIEHHYSDSVGVRADVSGGSLSRDTSDNSANYPGTVHLAALSLFADYHPWGGNFRISAGALVGDSSLDGNAVPGASGNFTRNGAQMSAPGESLSAKVSLPSVRPFVGVGWGHVPRDHGVYGLLDLGVAYGRPDVTLMATPNLAAAALSAGTGGDAERARLQGKANDYRLYPVIRAGMGWDW